jgi:hypothetical protein
MAFAGPGREHHHHPGIGGRLDRPPLVWREVREQTGAALHRSIVLADLDLAGDDDQVGALVNLVGRELLTGGQLDRDRPRLGVGAQDLRMVLSTGWGCGYGGG